MMSHSLQLRAGVMGWPLSHTLSPRLHGYWLKAYSLHGIYEALPVAPVDLEPRLRALHEAGLRGVNLTVPHKERACMIVDALDATASRIGAVNLVTINSDGKLLGSNTDAYGFSQNLTQSGFKYKKGLALVLGAGGAARAIVVALSELGFTRICVHNRTFEKAASLAQDLSGPECKIEAISDNAMYQRMKEATLLVNTTSLGMKGQPPLEIDIEHLPQDAVVTDIVYTPLQTELLRKAQERGHLAIDGLGMLLHQARPSFTAFYGPAPEVTEELRQFVLGGKTAQ